MKTYKLNKSLHMKKEEIDIYNALPDNSPYTKLSKKQIDFVNGLYYKYLSGKITAGWGTELFEIEQREKWPSGPRVKHYEAKRIVLNNLVYLNMHCKAMSVQKAAEKFHSTLSCRESYQVLIDKAFR